MKLILLLLLMTSCSKFSKNDFACHKDYPNKVRYRVFSAGLFNYRVLHWEGLFYLKADKREFNNYYVICNKEK